ncbi:helix-turn-helix domain-containing protein [Aquirufa salirivi]|uniref:Helix-turn-helix transcriptional regulator n=1 Tax=Aquirufa salirivi TaxID=3104729 RepID=A0ABW8RQB5_9BACT
MKKEEDIPYRFESLSQLHRMLELPKPKHPLISLIENLDNRFDLSKLPKSFIHNFYKISYKTNLKGKIKYGQSFYDFDEGGMLFTQPNQLGGTNGDHNSDYSGYTLFIHPDFLLKYPLSKNIKQYGFFSYDVSEALHLSDSEKDIIFSVFEIMQKELNERIDDYSQDVVVSQIELLLNYSNRFYKRQFITRKAINNDLIQKLEAILDGYFNSDTSLMQGIPTVQVLSENLHLSPNYLSDLLRSLTGQNTQQHIHNKLIEKAKEKLSTTNLTVSEIAYELGFEHSQSFSKLFKSKTNVSPLEFRASFS